MDKNKNSEWKKVLAGLGGLALLIGVISVVSSANNASGDTSPKPRPQPWTPPSNQVSARQ